jgi:CRP-like cAMP-binding protein
VEWRLFASVPAEEVQQLLSIARRRRFSRDEIVFHRNDPADSLHLVASGRFVVRVATALGETVTIAMPGPGDSFGEMALVAGGDHRSATVAALEPAETFAIFRDDFQRLRDQHHELNEWLIGFLAEEIRKLHDRLLEALFVSSEQRVLRRLSELGRLYARGADSTLVPLTQEQLAQLAGTTRETVNRVLRQQERAGTVELRRGKTIILDPQTLGRRAGERGRS